MADYEVRIADQLGNTLDIVDEWEKLNYTRAINAVGRMTLVLDGDYDITMLSIDNRISIWRTVGQRQYIDTDTIWFIRKIKRTLDQQGRRKIIVTGKSANELLDRRIIAYDAGSSEADKTDLADDMMKEIVTENLGSGAGTGRDLSAYLSIQADLSKGPTITKSFSRKSVLQTLQKISQATYESGSAVLFDIVSPTVTTLEFRTYRDQRGINHKHTGGVTPVLLSPERGTLANVDRTFDYTSEVNFVYAGGQGTGGDRQIISASSTRLNLSVFNRREKFKSANSSASSNLTSEADGEVRLGRPKQIFTGQILDTPGNRYGVEWGWGDAVTVLFEGESIDTSIDAVTVTVEGGRETVDVKLRADE